MPRVTGPPALVLAAGLPAAWLADGGVRIMGLPTPYGPLSYTLRQDGLDVVLEISAGLDVPAGGLLLDPPASGHAASGSGQPLQADHRGRVRITALPARVIWRP